MDLIKNMLEIYGNLSGHRFKGAITATRFVKLASMPGMVNDKLTKIDYDLVFKKILRNNFNKQQMDFYDFIAAIEELASRLESGYDSENKLPAVSSLVNKIINHIQ